MHLFNVFVVSQCAELWQRDILREKSPMNNRPCIDLVIDQVTCVECNLCLRTCVPP